MITWFLVIAYVIGVVTTPIVIGFAQPYFCMKPDVSDGLDNFAVFIATVFWPIVAAFHIVVSVADNVISEMTDIGLRLREWFNVLPRVDEQGQELEDLSSGGVSSEAVLPRPVPRGAEEDPAQLGDHRICAQAETSRQCPGSHEGEQMRSASSKPTAHVVAIPIAEANRLRRDPGEIRFKVAKLALLRLVLGKTLLDEMTSAVYADGRNRSGYPTWMQLLARIVTI